MYEMRYVTYHVLGRAMYFFIIAKPRKQIPQIRSPRVASLVEDVVVACPASGWDFTTPSLGGH